MSAPLDGIRVLELTDEGRLAMFGPQTVTLTVAAPARAKSAPAPRYGPGASLTSGPAAITLAFAARAAPIMSQAARRIVARHILLKKLKLSS